MGLPLKVMWSPAKPIIPKSNQINTNDRPQTFVPSYEGEEPQMGLIMSWHYGRQWLEERQTHQNMIIQKKTETDKFIPPDFSKWLEKRKPTKTGRQRAVAISVH